LIHWNPPFLRIRISTLRHPVRLQQNALAKALFAGISSSYDRWAEVFSLFQYRYWRASLLAGLRPQPGERILDVSTGTGAVALDLAGKGCLVVGLDLSRDMLREALRRLGSGCPVHLTASRLALVEGRAEDLPFPNAAFDAVTFTFLLRYVADPLQPMREISRVLRVGGRVAMLEFAIPRFPVTCVLWSFYVSTLLPVLTRLVSPAWGEVGAFLGGSIDEFYRRYPLADLTADWQEAGFRNVRFRHLSAGGALVVFAEKG